MANETTQPTTPQDHYEILIAKRSQLDRKEGALAEVPDGPSQDEQRNALLKQIVELKQDIAKHERDVASALRQAIERLDQEFSAEIVGEIKEFQFFDEDKTPVAKTSKLSDYAHASMSDRSLRDSAIDLLDTIRLARIQEEMDSTKYLGTVDTAFERLAERGKMFSANLGEAEPDDDKLARQAPADSEAKDDLLPMPLVHQMRGRLDAIANEECLEEFKENTGDASILSDRLKTIENLLVSHKAIGDSGLKALCSGRNQEYVRYVTRAIARRAERHLFVSILIFGMALLTALAADFAIGRSDNILFMENRFAICTSIFILIGMYSAYLGHRFRHNRVDKLNKSIRRKLCELFGFTRLKDDKNPADHPLFDKVPLRKFAKEPIVPIHEEQIFAISRVLDSARLASSKSILVAKNCVPALVILVALILYLLGLSYHPPGTALIYGRNASGGACLIERGKLRRINSSFYVMRTGAPSLLDNYESELVHVKRTRVQRIGWEPSERMISSLWNGESPDLGKDRDTTSRCREFQPGARPPVTQTWSLFDNLDFDFTQVLRPEKSDTLTALTKGFGELNKTLRGINPVRIEYQSTVFSHTQTQVLPQIILTFVTEEGEPFRVPAPRNAMLLPLFRTEVSGLRGDGLEDAFEHGRQSLADDRPDGERVGAFLSAMFEPLAECLRSGGSLDLDVVGFASPTWRLPGDHDVKLLNLSLAEGRRVALLERLAGALAKSGLTAAVNIRTGQGDDTLPLSEINNLPRRFGGEPENMQAELGRWVGKIDDKDLTGQLQQVLTRSAVIEVTGISGGSCASDLAAQSLNDISNMQASNDE